jgi:hypothetical protein
MATKISTAMFEIQATNNTVHFPSTTSLKNVTTSLSNKKKEK